MYRERNLENYYFDVGMLIKDNFFLSSKNLYLAMLCHYPIPLTPVDSIPNPEALWSPSGPTKVLRGLSHHM